MTTVTTHKWHVSGTAKSWENISCEFALVFDHQPTIKEVLSRLGDYQKDTIVYDANILQTRVICEHHELFDILP